MTTPKILISYFYYRKKNDLAEWLAQLPGDPLVFADSGAYSAHAQGGKVDVHEYGRWLQRNQGVFSVYANLDVIGDSKGTARNQRILEDEYGLTPLPVFHGGEPWPVLEKLLEDHKYIALGGMVASSEDLLWRWLVRCFKMAREAGAVFHGFGQTRQDVVEALPWYSVDSSSWAAGHIYGRLHLWEPKSCRLIIVRLYDKPSIYEHADLIRAHGVEPALLAEREGYHRLPVITVAARAWTRWEAWVRDRHGPISLPDRPDGFGLFFATEEAPVAVQVLADPGIHVFLADGASSNLDAAAQALTS